MNLTSVLKLFPALAAIAPMSFAAASNFGHFGQNLEHAKKTHFFTWFYLEETSSTNDTRTFQPSGPKFHDLVKLHVNVRADGSFRGLTLAVKRSFIDGPNAPFARDISKSFLETAIPEGNDEIRALINQIWNSPSGSGTMIRHENSPRPELPQTPTPSYRVFTGRDQTWSMPAHPFQLKLENRDGWLRISVQ
jgi:hypothetical protein